MKKKYLPMLLLTVFFFSLESSLLAYPSNAPEESQGRDTNREQREPERFEKPEGEGWQTFTTPEGAEIYMRIEPD